METVDYYDDREYIMDEMYLHEKRMEERYEWEEEYNRSLMKPAQIIVTIKQNEESIPDEILGSAQ